MAARPVPSISIPNIAARVVSDVAARPIPSIVARTVPDIAARPVPSISIPDIAARVVPDIAARVVPDTVARTVPDVALSANPDTTASASLVPAGVAVSAPDKSATTSAADAADAAMAEDSVEALAAFLENAVRESAPRIRTADRARAPVERATTVSYAESAERERAAPPPDSAAPDVARASEPSLAIAVATPGAAGTVETGGVPTGPASDEKSGIIELPSFTDEETSRPTVQMPPLVIEKEQKALHDAFDHAPEPGFDEWPDTIEHAVMPDRSAEPIATLLGMVPLTIPPRPSAAVPIPVPAAASVSAPTPVSVAPEATLPLEGITKTPAYEATFDASRLHRSTRPISSIQSTFSDSEVNLIIGSPERRRWIIAAVIGLIAIITAGIGWLLFMSVR